MSNLEEILAKLVAFPSVTQDFYASEKLLNWFEKEISSYLNVKRFEKNRFPSLVATTQNTKTPKLFLVAHIDVVPASKEMFHLKVKGDKLIGRGVFDMKFAAACYLKLVKELKKSIKNYDLGIMLTSDEEIGGFNGVKFLRDKGFNAQIVFLPDGGKDWDIENAAKGVWHFTATVKGKSAHGSRPWEGREPFTKLFAFLNELKRHFPQEPCRDPKHYHNTINIGKIIGGEATNQVASSATAFIDIRHIPEFSKKKLFNTINKIAKKFPGVKIETIVYGNAYKIDTSREEIKLWKQVLRKEFNIKAGITFSHGSSDARFFDMKKSTVLITRPKGGGLHSEEEWISKKALQNFYEALKKWVMVVTA